MRRAVLFDAYPHLHAGAQRTDHLLAAGLPAHGWSLTIVTPADGPFTDHLRADGIEPVVAPVPEALGIYGRRTVGRRLIGAGLAAPGHWRRLAETFRSLEAEVVHAVGHRGAALAGPAARLAGCRLVWHVQGVATARLPNLIGSAGAHAIAVPSRTVLRRMPELARWTEVTEIPNVVPDHARRDAPLPPPDEPGLVVSARIHPDKGIDVLVDAMALIRPRHPGVRATVLGASQDGHEGYLRELRERARRAGVADALHFAGHVDRPDEHLAGAALYVQPSRERTELLPLAILEAMAVGRAVVATDVGAVADVVRPGETGVLVPPEDPVALADAVCRLLDDRSLLTRLGAGGHALVAQHRFTADGLAESFAALYDRVAP